MKELHIQAAEMTSFKKNGFEFETIYGPYIFRRKKYKAEKVGG